MPVNWPSHVSVIGGGRWARVYLDVLLQLLPKHVSLSVHTNQGIQPVNSWLEKRSDFARVKVSDEPVNSVQGGVAIVANRPENHVVSARQAINQGFAVLVEKPISVSYDSALKLVNDAEKSGAIMGISQVFLFARYIHKFAEIVRKKGKLKSISVTWIDPKIESRYGEIKRTDRSVPAETDVLPHIIAILSVLNETLPELCNLKRMFKGRVLEIKMVLETVPCRVNIEREGIERRRFLEAVTDTGCLKLDFSQEPGTIWTEKGSQIGDPQWTTAPRPLASMLTSFFSTTKCGKLDPRFGARLPLHALRLSDCATKLGANNPFRK